MGDDAIGKAHRREDAPVGILAGGAKSAIGVGGVAAIAFAAVSRLDWQRGRLADLPVGF